MILSRPRRRGRPASSAARRLTLPAAALLLVGFGAPVAAQSPGDPVVVFLFRHAERAEDGTSDPPLSEAGRERAELVARILAEAGLTHVHTTDFRRTRGTGDPTASTLGLTMELYDPRDLTGFAERLRATPGRHLVLGHSNTTPALVEALGGDPAGPIDEMEYDRAYVVVVLPSGAAGSAILRYGRRFGGGG